MAYIDDPNQQNQQNQMDVFDNQGQAQGSGQPQQSTEVSTGASAPVSGSPQTSQTPQQSKPSQSKGSGMFTDVRKYMKANQGQAQKMGQAATGKFQKQTGAIGQQVQKQQSELQQRIAQNRARATAAQGFVTQQIDQAGQAQPPAAPVAGAEQAPQQFQTPQQADVDRFQNLRSGQERFDAVQALDISKQNARAKTLQNIAERAGTGQGRIDLLKKTLGENRRYTRGQQSLDNAILAGDEQARTNLISGVQQTGKDLGQQIQDARRSGRQSLGQLQQEQKQFQEGIGQQLTDAFTGVREGVTGQAQDYNTQMQELAQRMAESVGEGQLYEEDIAQLGDQGQEYLRGLADQYTTLGTERMGNVGDFIQARGLLGDVVGGEEDRQFSDTDLSRIATAQQRSRQRALESLGGISEGERAFLAQSADEVGGPLEVGRYTGQDIGLLGDQGFKGAREAALREIAGKIGEGAQDLESEYYNRRGAHTGYGYAPTVGDRDARGFAQQALESAGEFDANQLGSLYGAEIGDYIQSSNTGLAQQMDMQGVQDAIQERQDLINKYGYDEMTTGTGNLPQAQDLTEANMLNMSPEQREMHEAQVAAKQQFGEDLLRSQEIARLQSADAEGAQSFLDKLRSRQSAIQGLRQGKFGIRSRGDSE